MKNQAALCPIAFALYCDYTEHETPGPSYPYNHDSDSIQVSDCPCKVGIDFPFCQSVQRSFRNLNEFFYPGLYQSTSGVLYRFLITGKRAYPGV